MINIRELILEMLIEILEKDGYSHLVIRGVLDKYNYIESRDKAFIKRVTEGTLEKLIFIDYVLNQFSKVPVKKMKPLIRNLLRFSVYQLLFMDNVPDSAVCNEAVKLAGKRGFRSLSGYVNGLLRNIARNKENIEYPDPKKEKVRYTSVKYSMPEWIVELWDKEYGEEKTILMLEALQMEHPVVVRVSESLSHEQKREWLLSLSDCGVEWAEHPYLPNAYLLKDTEGIAGLPGYEEGRFTVQDVSSMLAVEAAGIRQIDKKSSFQEGRKTEDLLVLDVCAAPGGKSVYAGQLLSQKGKVIARDLTEYKIFLIEENIGRMKCANVEAEVWDALNFDESLKEKADIVLADLPCSGLGIMGKKRDIRYRSNPEKLMELEELQRQILSVIWQYVKPGGVLIYSTCTINPGENENMVKWFTKEYPFETESLLPYLPKEIWQRNKEQMIESKRPEDAYAVDGPEMGCLQLVPGIHETDGFFFARLRRR